MCKFNIGQIVCIDMSKGYYQILEKFDEIESNNQTLERYLVRKVFNDKMVFKPNYCDIVSEVWIRNLSKNKQQLINEIIFNNEDIKHQLAKLEIKRKYGYVRLGYCIVEDKNYDLIINAFNNLKSQFLTTTQIKEEIKKLEAQKLLELVDFNFDTSLLNNDKKAYYIVGGRFNTDLIGLELTYREINLQ